MGWEKPLRSKAWNLKLLQFVTEKVQLKSIVLQIKSMVVEEIVNSDCPMVCTLQ